MSSRDPVLKTCLNPPPQTAPAPKTTSSGKPSLSAEELWMMIERNLGRKIRWVPSNVDK